MSEIVSYLETLKEKIAPAEQLFREQNKLDCLKPYDLPLTELIKLSTIDHLKIMLYLRNDFNYTDINNLVNFFKNNLKINQNNIFKKYKSEEEIEKSIEFQMAELTKQAMLLYQDSKLKPYLDKLFTEDEISFIFVYGELCTISYKGYAGKALEIIIELAKLKEYVKLNNGMVSESMLKTKFKYANELPSIIKKAINEYKKHANHFNKYIGSVYADIDNALEAIKNNKAIEYKTTMLSTDPKLRTLTIIYNSKFESIKYNAELNREKSLRSINISDIKKILIDYNINIDESSIISSDNLLEKVKLIDKFLPTIKSYSNLVLYFINELDLNTLSKLVNLISINLINEKYILDNIYYFINNKLNNFVSNIAKLGNYKCNIKEILDNYKDILFMDTNKLSYLLALYSSYGINLSNKNIDYSILRDDYSDILDEFIEIGEGDLIVKDTRFINPNSKNIVKRAIISKSCGENITNEFNIIRRDILTGDRFIIKEELYDDIIVKNYENFIPEDILEILKTNNESINNIDLSLLDRFKINNISFRFESLIISKNKILKNMNKLINSGIKRYSYIELLFFSIIYNYPNTIDPYEIIEIKSMLGIKSKKKQN